MLWKEQFAYLILKLVHNIGSIFIASRLTIRNLNRRFTAIASYPDHTITDDFSTPFLP